MHHIEKVYIQPPGLWNLQKMLRIDRKSVFPLYEVTVYISNVKENAESCTDCLERECRDNVYQDDEDYKEEVERLVRRI